MVAKIPVRAEQIDAANRIYTQLDQWKRSDRVLGMLRNAFPSNTKDTDVIVKVAAINQLYSVRLYPVNEMADHIASIFKRSLHTDELVENIAALPTHMKQKRYLSFASKYCHFFVDSEKFPIFDRYALKTLRKHLGRDAKSRGDRPQYADYCFDINTIRNECGLRCSLKELDRYLWLCGAYLERKTRKGKVSSELKRFFEKGDNDPDLALIRAVFESSE